MCRRTAFQKFRILLFDETLICDIFYIPLEAGLHYLECVLRTFFGTANWAQFCPGNENRNPRWRADCDFCRHEIELFCGQKCTNGWFFDIYIQGSKKYNFKS
jgi:hypothetical protein